MQKLQMSIHVILIFAILGSLKISTVGAIPVIVGHAHTQS